MTNAPFYRERLLSEFNQRTQRNPRYSLRSFAAFLGIDPSALCRLFSGRQAPSSGTCLKLARKLGLPLEEQLAFLRSAIDERGDREYRQWAARAQSPELLEAAIAEEALASPAPASEFAA